MESLKELYRIGPGPSSSHTVAPQNACKLFLSMYPEVLSFDAELFGSLALTGVGHSTDTIIRQTFAPRMCRVTFDRKSSKSFPSGLVLRGFDEKNREVAKWTVLSLGGGAFDVEEVDLHLHDEVFPHNTMAEIMSYCEAEKISFADYVFQFDKEDIKNYLSECMSQMLKTVKGGLRGEGLLPGTLKIKRVAKSLNLQANMAEDEKEKQKLLLMSYAYAACEENAAGKICVTAPTMGASGVIAALVYYYYYDCNYSRERLIRALAVAGLFGNVVKKNASISGAIAGCQAEVGTACAMASAFVAYLEGLSNHLIAYAAEVGIEHHLGLTCDPVGGYVIIPCIERNAVATLRALDNALLAKHVGGIKENRVSFDDVVRTMNYTGKKLAVELKETSLGGLAKEISSLEKEEKKEERTLSDYDNTLEEEEPVLEMTYNPDEIHVVEQKLDLQEEIAKPVRRRERRRRKEKTEEVIQETPAAVISEEVRLPESAEENRKEEALPEISEEVTREEERKEGSEFRLEDFDLSLLDAFNKTYKLNEEEKKEVDAFMDKLEIKL